MTQNDCINCPVHNKAQLKKLGIDTDSWDYIIAIAGNPNTGKSTVFNSLTGLRQHTGNWPGKTVTRAEGGFSYNDKKYKLIDLPGTYSLLSTSTDEEVARNFILFGQPDVTIITVDATRLERNLNLVLQVLEITDRAIVCLNLIDEAERHKMQLDDRLLSKKLGVPVVPTAARNGRGIDALLEKIEAVASGQYLCKPYRVKNKSKKLERVLEQTVSLIESKYSGIKNARWLAMRLLEGDKRIEEAFINNELPSLINPN